MKCSYCDKDAVYGAWVYDNEPYQILICKENDYTIGHGTKLNDELKKKKRGKHNWAEIDELYEKPEYTFEYDKHDKGWFAYCSHFFWRGSEYAYKTKEKALKDMLLGIYKSYSENRVDPQIVSPGYAKKLVKRSRWQKSKAKDALTRMRDILTELIDCKDDVIRARLYNEFNNEINQPYRKTPERVLILSQMINDPDYPDYPEED